MHEDLATAHAQARLGSRHPLAGDFSPCELTPWSELRSPLGASISSDGTASFAVYSRNAERMLLEIYETATGTHARYEYWMTRGADDVFRARLHGVAPGTLYGFRAWGRNWPFSREWRRGNCIQGFVADVDRDGNRFNPNKLLFDPYARELSHDRETREMKQHGHHAEMYGSGPGLYTGFGHEGVVRRAFDTGPFAPKSVLIHDQTRVSAKPHIAQKDLVIYEAHPRGLSRHPSSQRLQEILQGMPEFEGVENVPLAYRGTYRGAAYLAKYLKALGVNAIEFLPVHESSNALCPDDEPEVDRTPGEPPHGTYWGYMTYGYFAPDRRYAWDQSPGGPTREFKEMVSAFHEAGIAVLLDVVFNHSGEGGLWEGDYQSAELLFLRGLDNAEYYALTGEGRRYYWESTGCGNNLNAQRPVVARLVLDSLEYWACEMGIDGFRFDLATVLGRVGGDDFRFRAGGELLSAIEELAEREGFVAIAEAWDTAMDGYRVGEFPQGWAEWNGVYRDAVRRFVRGDEGQLQRFLEVMNGDYRDFADQGGPHKSVNFVTAHDGFTLMDLVSYTQKNNDQSWPFGPCDGGSDHNDSSDWDGDQKLRRQCMRNFMTLLLFARGVPMLRGGDEFAQTINGNNNPYKIDSVATWHNFEMIATRAPNRIPTGGSGKYHDNYGVDAHEKGTNGFFSFVRGLLALRAEHACLRQDKFADFLLDAGDDVTYLFKREDSESDLEGWERCVSLHIDGSAIGDVDFALLINMHSESVEFRLPRATPREPWLRVLDTAIWAEPRANLFAPAESPQFPGGSAYHVHPRSIAAFMQARQ
ncbi:MAG: glycogen debranching protein [Myxococcota bacterium]